MMDTHLPVFVSIRGTNNPDQISNSFRGNVALKLAGNVHHGSLSPRHTHCTAIQPFSKPNAFFYSQISQILTHQSRAPAAIFLHLSSVATAEFFHQKGK